MTNYISRIMPRIINGLFIGLVLVIVAFNCGSIILAQPLTNQPTLNQPSSNIEAEADAYFQAQDWNKSIKAYSAITQATPANGKAWYRLGYALQATGSYNQAAPAYYRSVEISGNPAAMYNLACVYAKLNNKDKAFEWLDKAFNAGFRQAAKLKNDPDLAGLRDDARFATVTALAAKLVTPCLVLPEYKQFDFWVGDWDVKSPQGQPVGSSSVQRVVDGCVIFENWTGGQGGSGKSFNFYNAVTGKWHQTWVGNGGGVLELDGEYKDGALRYTGVTPSRNGQKTMERLTFFNLDSGHVRQLWEQSKDEGKTWAIVFDGDYVKKK